MRPITVSAVIPTRNRPGSLRRTLTALAAQERLPDEVIVADASDRPSDIDALAAAHPPLSLRSFHTAPSVCAQRNEAIRRAGGSHIFLCDDDIEPPPEYLRRLEAYLVHHCEVGAVTGVISEPDAAGHFSDPFPVPGLRQLVTSFVAQRTVWADVEATTGTAFTALPLALLKGWYRRRGNTWSLAGWPLVTQVNAPIARTAIYGLGAALVRRDWLLASPYDERLGSHGIGDNYGVALGFPGDRAIILLTDLPVRHHKAQDNRLESLSAQYRRVLALHYFMRRSSRFSSLNVAFLVWSLMASAAAHGIRGRGDPFRITIRALRVIVTGRNPLLGGRTAA
ncbi:MAG: glycosyltransferase family 2 protein [Gemmatimonadetes bacterium]|nr:glycosyltransferase family 2 protein [Gemmatimonadota bacterium]